MISTQVLHHTNFDMATWRACFVKHMMIMCQYFPRLWYDPYQLHARGLGLCLFFFSELVCDLLPRRLFHGFCQRCIARRVSLTSNAWEDTGPIWCLSYPSGGAPLIPGHYVFGSWGDWLWGLVSPTMHASPPTLWSVLPTRLGMWLGLP